MMIEYLFNPDEIDSILYDYRFIRQKIDAPDQEGIPSESFPTLRKTGRELYRILTNRHYTHLRKLLYLLDLCLSEGWDQPTLIRTQSEAQFDSAVSELLVASNLLNLGFSISSFESSKGQERVADISAYKDNELGCIAEVYCPRDWEGLELFFEDIRLSILHLDSSYDFICNISSDLIRHFDNQGNLLYFDPWKFSDYYENHRQRSKIVGSLLDWLFKRLTPSAPSKIEKTIRDIQNNLAIHVLMTKVTQSVGLAPERSTIIAGPTLTGYAPELMFEKLLRTRLSKKIAKRQAIKSCNMDLTVLFVDISKLGYLTQFTHPSYQAKFVESIRSCLNLSPGEIDTIIFFELKSGLAFGIDPVILYKSEAISMEQVVQICEDVSYLDKATDDMFIKRSVV